MKSIAIPAFALVASVALTLADSAKHQSKPNWQKETEQKPAKEAKVTPDTRKEIKPSQAKEKHHAEHKKSAPERSKEQKSDVKRVNQKPPQAKHKDVNKPSKPSQKHKEQPAANHVFCTRCGNQAAREHNFCARCGLRLK